MQVALLRLCGTTGKGGWKMDDVLAHFCAGCVFAGTGAAVRGMCPHAWHRVLVGTLMVLIEAVITVALFG